MFPGYWSYQVTLVTVSWIIGFVPLWAGWAPRWRWRHAIGLALVASPFVRMGISVYFDFFALVETTLSGGTVVLEAIPRAALWESVWRRTLYYLLVPLSGLFLLWDGRPTTRDLRAAGLGTREGAWKDTLHGFALFVFIAAAYAVALGIAVYVAREFLPATGDESRVWANMTPLLIVLLSGVAGISEEFLFRGLLFRTLERAMPVVAAAVVQAVFFALVHAGYMTWTHVLGPLAFGLGMAWITRVLGLVPAILLHAEVNVAFFAVDVSRAVPSAWLLLVALALVNAYAAWVTRFAAVRTLWASLVGALRRLRRPPSPA